MKITTKIFIAAVVLLAVGVLAGCQKYRYPCQNVENWDKPMCQKPVCAVHQECPSNIFKNDPALADHIKN
jgi:hypothetical protein